MFRFTKAGTLMASSTDLENAAASALAGAPAGATFVTVHTDRGLQHLFVTDDVEGQEGVAFSIARAMNARSDEVDEVPDLLSVPGLARLAIQPRTRPMMDTQSGAEFASLARTVGDLLMPGEWVAMSIRPAGVRSEVKWQNRWLDHHQMRTHHSRKSGAPVVSMFAGGRDNRRARDIVVRAAFAIPGFGLSVRGESVSRSRAVRGWLSAMAAGAAIIGAGVFLPDVTAGLVPGGLTLWGGIAAGVSALGGALTAAGLLPSEHRSLTRSLMWGRVPGAPKRRVPPRKPRRESRRVNKEGVEETTPEFDGDYPLQETAFLVGPHIPVSLVAPHASGSGGASTGERSAPAELRELVGPQVGVNDQQPVHLSAADAWSGWAAIGQPGSGKTALLEHLWGWVSSERVRPTGVPGATRHAMVAFDTKGDGLATAQYVSWLRANGDGNAFVVNAFDPDEQVGIDIFPYLPGESATAWARKVTSAMRYIWGEDSIGAESFDTLTRVLAASRLVTPAIASRVTLRQIPQDASPFFYANVLLTNEGDDLGVELAGAILEAAANPSTSTGDLVAVASQMAPLYGPGKTPAQRGQLVKAPRTKVAALMAAEQWWSRPSKNSWSTLLDADVAVIVNTGQGTSNVQADEKLRTDLSGLMMYTLAEEVKRTCVGWFEQGRAVWVFSDEVKHIANSSSEVVTWMRHDARAYGLRVVFATQTPDTLVPEVRKTMLGFGTLVLFAQNDALTVRELVAELQMSGGQWEASDVANLPRWHAIVRTTYQSHRLEPFTISVPDYRSARDARMLTP